MANTISTTELVANLALAKLVNNNSLLMTSSRAYEGDFQMQSYQINDSLNIRKQNFFDVGDGRVGTVQDVIEATETLVIEHQFHTLIKFSSRELTLEVDTAMERFNERYVAPAMQEIVRQMELSIAIQGLRQVHFATGTPGTPVNSFGAVEAAGVQMLEHAMPITENAYMALSPNDASQLKISLQNNFNDTLNEDISFKSALGHLSYFDIFQNQSMPVQIAGSGAGTPLIDGVVPSGNTIIIDGLTPDALRVFAEGDIITVGVLGTVSGVNSVNPIGRSDVGQLKQFVITGGNRVEFPNDKTRIKNVYDADSGGRVSITVEPAIISDVANPRRNVTQELPNDAVITLLGAGTTYKNNFTYSPRGLDIVAPPLPKLNSIDSYVATDRDVNVSLRVNQQGDILNDVNILRLDVLCGFQWHGDYSTRIVS